VALAIPLVVDVIALAVEYKSSSEDAWPIIVLFLVVPLAFLALAVTLRVRSMEDAAARRITARYGAFAGLLAAGTFFFPVMWLFAECQGGLSISGNSLP
jgi:predicted permease